MSLYFRCYKFTPMNWQILGFDPFTSNSQDGLFFKKGQANIGLTTRIDKTAVC